MGTARLSLGVAICVLTAAASAAAAAAAGAGAKEPCTNGSFEELAPGGFPTDWEAVGATVGVTDDARSGRRALRMVRSADTKTPETGLNRAWRAGSGRRGAMVDRLKGGIEFWYKAVAADGAELRICAIPMTVDPIEKTGSPRAVFKVPAEHVGDGRWHCGRLKYDYTDNPKVKWVHFAARIVGKAGELLLDDVAYVERVGCILRFGRIHVDEDGGDPGRRGVLRARVANAGDVPARDVRVTVELPGDLKAVPAEVRLGALGVDDAVRAAWRLVGARTKAATLKLTAAAGETRAHAEFRLAPELVLESFGPAAPVVLAGERVPLECVLRNTGHAFVTGAVARFAVGGGQAAATVRAEEVAPGRSVVLRSKLAPRRGAPVGVASVRVRAGNVAGAHTATTSFVTALAADVPPASGRLRALSADRHALLENEHVRLVFRRSGAGFGPGEFVTRTPKGWRTVAWLPRLSRVAWRVEGAAAQDVSVAARSAPQAERDKLARLTFACRVAPPGSDKPAFRVACAFALAPGARAIAADYRLTAEAPAKLLAFDGPALYALDRDEAVFPGLEWLVGEEVSSGTLDIAADHPHRERHVVHPNMVTVPAIGVHGAGGTVGLLWDARQKWDGRRDRPAVVFASPDRWANQRGHLMGLFLPSVPEHVEPNRRTAARPYPLRAGQELRLRCRLYADGTAGDALSAVDEYLRTYGLPKPGPLPHGSWDGEIQFSMRAYLESLWDAETRQWWTSKRGHPLMSRLARPRAYVADLLLGAIASPGESVRAKCLARATEVLGLIGGEARYDAQRAPGRADLAMAGFGPAAGLLAAMGADGSWRFDADRIDRGVFQGLDYAELGPNDAVAVGTCARNAYVVLRYARVAGDEQAYRRMRKTLELMETFRVPRAAQVWEVPFHTPDILAAADAIDAYVEAYRFRGEKRWLRDAVTWARRGLPFVYLWDDPERPFLLGGSIPVFGATWYRGSWFGRPVQWNGLRYANALLKLAEHDDSRPWRRIAELLIRSAVHQQDLDGEDVALWPDNVSAIDGEKCPWVFAPRQILRNILKLTGRDEDAATVIVGEGRRRVHVSAAAAVRQARWDGEVLTFRVAWPKGTEGVVLVANVTRPVRVVVNGEPAGERRDVERGAEPGWRYDNAHGFLSIRAAAGGQANVRVEGARFRAVERLPRLARRIAFEFEQSAEGWAAQHDVGALAVRGGALVGAVTGPDPYLARTQLRVAGSDCPVVRIRLRLTAGQTGQFYWTTASSPAFAEDKTVRFAVRADGQFHEYRLDLAGHPMWAGQTVTGLRIDPGNGARRAEFALDTVRGAAK